MEKYVKDMREIRSKAFETCNANGNGNGNLDLEGLSNSTREWVRSHLG